MSKEAKSLKVKSTNLDSKSKPGNKLREAMKASKKLNFSDLQELALYLDGILKVKKLKEIDDLEKQLKQLKGS
jgi:hypothetical protein